jgi:hypothetical protein
MKSFEKKNLQTPFSSSFLFVQCSSHFSEISHASTAACSPSPEPECCTESAQHLPKNKIEPCFSTDASSDCHLTELDWSAAPRSFIPQDCDVEWLPETPATVPAIHGGGKGLWDDILQEANAVVCAPLPSDGTDVSRDSNAADISDEELIAMLAGCAAPTGQQTPPHDSRTFSRVEVAADRNIILHLGAEGECCSFLHLEGCANDLDSLQPEALVRESHRLDDQDQHSLWSDDSNLQGL